MRLPPKSLITLYLLAAASVAIMAGTAQAAADATTAAEIKRIFFGDLHTHSNLSMDAMLMQIFKGRQRGPEDACVYARACAQVDFYGQSDHAEMLHKAAWDRSVAAVKACNAAVAVTAGEPELVVFQGFEWTSSQKDKLWGHKNVFFANDAVPEMPIGAYPLRDTVGLGWRPLLVMLDIYRREGIGAGQALRSAAEAMRLQKLGDCAAADADPELCVRVADEPRQLWAALRSYRDRPEFAAAGYDVLAIPHGTAWGMAKLAADWDIQLRDGQHDPDVQRLIEVYSGHGNSEEYRDFTAPGSEYESCRTRAGRLEYAWCRRHGGDDASCAAAANRASETLEVSFRTTAQMWGRCGQCPDCFQPAERYQPQGSVQAAMARTGFAGDGTRTRFHFGFIAATDDHSSRPASVLEKKALTDWPAALGVEAAADASFVGDPRNRIEAERIASYMYPGGLVAVHATSRTRESLWAALKRREVYGTSGPRILLWFDADLGTQHAVMGARITGDTSPRFRVEAIGAPQELPGCSAATRARWGDDVISDVCLGTCYNPGDRRVGIDRIEVIRITPQTSPDEPIGDLIEDPWLVIPNPHREPSGHPSPRFVTTFTDAGFSAAARDALYYVRVLQEPTPAVNGVPMSTADGPPKPCPVDATSDCLSDVQERAWSSPIYVDWHRKAP